MAAWYRFRDWRLRTKMALLLVMASLLPLGVATWISIHNARAQLLTDTESLLIARSDQLVGRIDTMNQAYQRAVNRMALVPDVLRMMQAQPATMARLKPEVQALLGNWPATDPGIRGVAILDAAGTVLIATEPALVGKDMSSRSFVQQALRGVPVISDVYLAEPEVGNDPAIAFLAPILGSDRQLLGIAAIWAHGGALRDALRQSNGLAGEGSFAVLFDGRGIRIAHAEVDEMDFHPGVRLPPETIDALVAEQRFGARTRELLSDPREVSARVRSILLDGAVYGMTRVYAPAAQRWSYVVGRRCTTVPWTVFYASPEASISADVARIVNQKLLFAAVIMFAATAVGALFAMVILKPIRSLSSAAQAVAAGDLNARTVVDRKDELGSLGVTFNNMASRIQEQSAELVRESEAQFRKLFESMTEGFCTIEVIFDDNSNPVDYRFVNVNAAFERMAGFKATPGSRMRELVPNIEEYWIRLYGRVAQTGEPVMVEDESRELRRHFFVSAYRVGGPESRRVAVLFNDISDRRTAQRRLQAQLESLDLLQQITRAIGERLDLPSIFQIVVRSLEDRLPLDFGCICLLEPGEKRLLVSRLGVKGLPLATAMGLDEQGHIEIDENGLSRCVRGQLVHEPDVAAVQFPFPQRLAAAGLRSLVAAPLLVESQVFGVLIAARRAADSFSSGECEFLRQLSEHVALAAHHAQLYTALQGAYEDLRRTQQAAMQQERLRALGQMASGIAHDINNAISPVALYADSLLEREKDLSAQGRTQLQTVQRAIHDVAATVARMREFYRPREPQLLLQPVQLNELVPHVLELTRARWSTMTQQRGLLIEARSELQPELASIMGSESELREALTNLVLNAVDAMPEGGTLTLRTRNAGTGQVAIEVSDTGVGMDEDSRRRCLEPFFTTKGERGTGLGLAMVYGVVRRHGAAIDIDSAPGEGTTVRLRFNATADALPAADDAQGVIPTGLRILVVDDDPVLLRSLRETLEHDGHVVITAGGGQEGIEQFQAALTAQQAFDVAFTDLGMPYFGGRQVARAIKALSPETPVIMLTGWGQRLVSEGDVPQDVDLVLSKPPKLRELREALSRCRADRQF